jgi:hypothetical protein
MPEVPNFLRCADDSATRTFHPVGRTSTRIVNLPLVRGIVGADDDGSVRGLEDPDGVMNALASISRDNCRPSLYPLIERVDLQGRAVVIARIPRRVGAPYETNSGQCWVRVCVSKRLTTRTPKAPAPREEAPTTDTNPTANKSSVHALRSQREH